MTASRTKPRLLLWAALGYTAFAVYGSLVPLRFRPMPLEAAWRAFQDMRYLDLGIGSRADWVANILLFVPLAFFWLGALWPRRPGAVRAAACALVLLAGAALGTAIEFVQIYFPPRTVSLNDLYAQALGAAAGVALWLATGERFKAWLDGWFAEHTPRSAAQRFFYVYLFLLFGYSLLPLDLTISMTEIFRKWREGKVLLLPFSARYPSAAEMAYALLSDIAIWVPAAFLWRLALQRSVRQVMLFVVASAALIELLQLFIYSRITSTTDVLTAAAGGALGAVLAARYAPALLDKRAEPARISARLVLLWLLAFAGWLGVMMTVFWYPFDFVTEWRFVRERVMELQRVPFHAYYYGTEFRAATEVLHKTGFFFPLGALLAVAAGAVGRGLRVAPAALHAASAVVIAGVAAGIEVGQIFLPDKNADGTDWILEILGGMAGYACLRMLAPQRQKRWT